MKSVVVWSYFGTGEGDQLKIIFSNSGRMSDEDAVNKLKDELDPYFHVGIKVLPLESIEFNVDWMKKIKNHVPVLYKYLVGDIGYIINIDYSYYVNHS